MRQSSLAAYRESPDYISNLVVRYKLRDPIMLSRSKSVAVTFLAVFFVALFSGRARAESVSYYVVGQIGGGAAGTEGGGLLTNTIFVNGESLTFHSGSSLAHAITVDLDPPDYTNN